MQPTLRRLKEISSVASLRVISIVDDDLSVRAATCNLLRSHGYVVYTFSSAEGFLTSSERDRTDCVIADVRMPTMSGLEMQAQLRARGSGVPFIFITALPDASARARALESGASGFLTKPFDEGVLIRCIERALRD
jgi:FixJ family two-component response regulator